MNEFNLKYKIVKKEQSWIASCPQIKTFGYSKVGEQEAIDDLIVAINIFFEVHIERNTLDKALKHFNITI